MLAKPPMIRRNQRSCWHVWENASVDITRTKPCNPRPSISDFRSSSLLQGGRPHLDPSGRLSARFVEVVSPEVILPGGGGVDEASERGAARPSSGGGAPRDG